MVWPAYTVHNHVRAMLQHAFRVAAHSSTERGPVASHMLHSKHGISKENQSSNSFQQASTG
jgi:hypothetical protein